MSRSQGASSVVGLTNGHDEITDAGATCRKLQTFGQKARIREGMLPEPELVIGAAAR
jgi:hypothetical protein